MDKILKIIFIVLFIIFLPLGEFARIDFGNTVAITAVDIGVATAVVFDLFYSFFKKNKVKPILLKPILFFTLTCLVSLLVNISILKSHELLVSSLYLVRWLCYAGIYVVLVQQSRIIEEKLHVYLVLSGFLTLIIGYIQFFLYPDLRNLGYLGWDQHLFRMFGTFFDPNFFGAFLVLYFLYVLHVFFEKNIIFVQKNKIASILVLLLTLIGVFLTYSRSAYIMLLIGTTTYFILIKRNTRIFVSICISSIICLTVVLLLTQYNEKVTRYAEGTNLFRGASSVARIYSAGDAFIIFEKNPIFGVGFNAYRYAQIRYKLISGSENAIQIDHGGAGTDNSFLFVLATTGIVGFVIYINLWRHILFFHQKINKNQFNPLLVSSSIALFIDSLFVNSLFYPFIMLWMWVLVGITE